MTKSLKEVLRLMLGVIGDSRSSGCCISLYVVGDACRSNAKCI